jgi:hypothetical protein
MFGAQRVSCEWCERSWATYSVSWKVVSIALAIASPPLSSKPDRFRFAARYQPQMLFASDAAATERSGYELQEVVG